jgi:outer membrane biogenesis lipoprotein LolB
MKKLFILAAALLLASCSSQECLVPDRTDPDQLVWKTRFEIRRECRAIKRELHGAKSANSKIVCPW